jgi:hypothetical protein
VGKGTDSQTKAVDEADGSREETRRTGRVKGEKVARAEVKEQRLSAGSSLEDTSSPNPGKL